MLQQRPLVLVDDDAEDQELLLLALAQLGFTNEVKVFDDAEQALEYLYRSEVIPFLIVSDVNMPRMDGIAFKKRIDSCSTLKAKCIPFIFLSTSTKYLDEMCDLSIQGYFEKGSTWIDLCETVRIIMRYWERTRHHHLN